MGMAEIHVQYTGRHKSPGSIRWRVRRALTAAIRSCRWALQTLLVHGVLEVAGEGLAWNPSPEVYEPSDLVASAFCSEGDRPSSPLPAEAWMRASRKLRDFELMVLREHAFGHEVMRIRNGMVLVHELVPSWESEGNQGAAVHWRRRAGVVS